MGRKLIILFTFFVLLFSSLFIANPTEASSIVKGKFVNVTYDEVQLDKNVTEKSLKSITLKNEQGRTTTLNIDKYAKLSVDSVKTKIDAFKLGMEVEADVELRRVKALRGSTGTERAQINHRDRVVTGTVNKIDSDGEYLTVRLADGK